MLATNLTFNQEGPQDLWCCRAGSFFCTIARVEFCISISSRLGETFSIDRHLGIDLNPQEPHIWRKRCQHKGYRCPFPWMKRFFCLCRVFISIARLAQKIGSVDQNPSDHEPFTKPEKIHHPRKHDESLWTVPVHDCHGKLVQHGGSTGGGFAPTASKAFRPVNRVYPTWCHQVSARAAGFPRTGRPPWTVTAP